MMKYITVMLLAVFLIPFVQNVAAQSVLGPTSGGLGGGIKEIPSGGGGQSAQNTTGQAGQSATNATSQNSNGTSGGNPIMDMLGKIIPGQ